MTGLVAGLAMVLLLGGSAWLFLQHERSNTLAYAKARLQINTQMAAAAVGQELGTLDLIVSLILDDYAAGRSGLAGVANQVHARIADAPRRLEGLASWAVLDAQGTAVYASNPTAKSVNFSWRDYFIAHRQGTAEGAFISSPIIATVPPYRRVVVQSWAIRDAGGGFDGVVMAVTTWRHHGPTLLAARGVEGDLALIVDRDRQVYAADSANWPVEQKEPPRGPVLDRLTALDVGSDQSWHLRDESGDGWLVTASTIPGTSLSVVAAARDNVVLVAWWRVLWQVAIAVVLTACLVGVLAAGLRHMFEKVRRAQVAAEAGDRAKAKFLATMSHEIRTPMTAVLGMVDLLNEKALPPDAHDNVAAIRRAGEQLLAIINDILDFLKLENGEFALARTDFDLFAALEEVQSIMSPQATQRGLDFLIDRDDPAPLHLQGDPRRLKQVLFNLAGNAIKFTLTGGITLRVRTPRSFDDGRVLVRIDVEDTGVGFDAGEASTLFDAFTQTERTTREAVGGTGLGLAICKQLVEAMGGTIGCTSTPGAGSVFWFEIPFPLGQICTLKEERVAAVSARTLRILVAEDATLNQDLITELLTRMGHTPTMTANGVEFLNVAAREPYDLLVLDIGMPVLDGEASIRRLRACEGINQSTPAVALTANVIESDRQRYLKAGFDACLGKPIERGRLFQTIERLTAKAPPAAEAPLAPTSRDMANNLPIDKDFLGQLTKDEMAHGKVIAWVRQAFDEAEKLLACLEGNADPNEAARMGHRLRGTAGNFGLRAISNAAAEIERDGNEGVLPSLANLKDAIARTRTALDAGEAGPVQASKARFELVD